MNLAGNFYCKYKGCFVERPPTAISDKRTIGIFKLKENRKKFDSELLIFSHFLCFSTEYGNQLFASNPLIHCRASVIQT